jgi:hypothetical protein
MKRQWQLIFKANEMNKKLHFYLNNGGRGAKTA